MRAGFALFMAAGADFACLGAVLAADVQGLSGRLSQEALARSSIPGRPLSLTRFGGILLLAIGLGSIVIGIVGLTR